ncbi:MAG TPA: hypothetical protein VLL08_21510 [Kineosporiaceae bacterium]|nr:hypothetical protein [Kineosporiaceae bacterium]
MSIVNENRTSLFSGSFETLLECFRGHCGRVKAHHRQIGCRRYRIQSMRSSGAVDTDDHGHLVGSIDLPRHTLIL